MSKSTQPSRVEADVLAQIQAWAADSENIRAIVMTSSRADPARAPDILSDYDVQVFVRDTVPFVDDDSWVSTFGSIMVRWPLHPQPTFRDEWVTQLVLFEDGVRIDFQITATRFIDVDELDNGYRVLVDKDGLAAQLPTPTYTHFGVMPPTAEAFADRINAFWWDIIYVAKALHRGELNYAKSMLEGTVRFEKFLPLIIWAIGTRHGWPVKVGLYGRWIHNYLDAATWARYEQTFAGAAFADNWRALFATLDFAREMGHEVADALGFDYPTAVDDNVTRFIYTIHDLPRKDA